MSGLNGSNRRDVIISAPPAILRIGNAPPDIGGTADEVAWLRGELRHTIADLEAKTLSANTLAHIAVCLAKCLQVKAGAGIEVPIVIPLAEFEQMRGAEISLSGNADGDITVRIRGRAPFPFVEGV